MNVIDAIINRHSYRGEYLGYQSCRYEGHITDNDKIGHKTAKNNFHCLIRLFFLFVLNVTVPVISYSYVPSYGLFGELKSLVVVDENKEKMEEVSSRITVQKKQKGNNRFHLWLLVLAIITCLQLLAYSIKTPRSDTIVAKKIRMNN